MLPSAQISVLTTTCLVLLGMFGCTYEVEMPPDPCENNTAISFAGDILPILDTHCNGCHAGGAPSAGLSLTSHSTVAERASEGSLIERLRLPADNIRMMPLNGEPLPECDIILFESWVSAGAPDN